MRGFTGPILGGHPAHPKRRLLLAEDNYALCVFLCELLEDEYDVEVATHGGQAWAAVQRELPDIVLADLVMPELDGIELTARLRADARTAALPILLLTACNDPETLRRILEGGADGFLLKPFRPLELLDRLRRHLAREHPGRN